MGDSIKGGAAKATVGRPKAVTVHRQNVGGATTGSAKGRMKTVGKGGGLGKLGKAVANATVQTAKGNPAGIGKKK